MSEFSELLVKDGDDGRYRILFPLPYLGKVKARTTDEIKSSNWFVGCETLDRDYANYDQYKEYLVPLGIKGLRFQGGWAKTEKEKGVYSWEWLDHIIDDAVGRGLKPWLQLGYGNTIYEGAGGDNLGAGMPLSEVGFAAYLRWVHGMVSRYKDRVWDWEVWNEPNFGDNKMNTPEIAANFNIETAKIIKELQPDARISALALGHINLDYVERFFKYLYDRNACELFHNVTYHDYVYNPDSNKLAVYKMRQIVEKYAPHLILRQGENGAPSEQSAGGALYDYQWTELSQAKWDTRRMLENLGNDIESSVYSIVDLQYKGNGPIRKRNSKGLLESNSDNIVLKRKMAYFAVQTVASIFDDTLERVKGVSFLHNVNGNDTDKYSISSERSVSVYGYQHKETKERVYSFWKDESIPDNECNISYVNLSFVDSHFRNPVVVDIITGSVYDIPKEQWSSEGNVDRFRKIPVYDAPILIAEKSLISL